MSLVLAWYISKYHLQHLTLNSKGLFISSVIFIKLHLLHKIQLWSQKWWSQRINQQAIVSDCYFSLTLLGLCVKPGSRKPAMFFSVARKWPKSMSSFFLVKLTSPDWIYWFSHLYFLFQSKWITFRRCRVFFKDLYVTPSLPFHTHTALSGH